MKMWTCTTVTFDAAHHLPYHPGKCKHLHGHTYTVEVGVRCDPTDAALNREGFLIDMGDLRKALEDVVSVWDHNDLNNFMEVPSAENIAKAVQALIYFPSVRVRVGDAWELCRVDR